MMSILILVIVFLMAILNIFLIDYFIHFQIKRIIKELDPILSVYIFKSSVFFSSGLLLSELYPIFQNLSEILSGLYSGNNLLLQAVSLFSVFYGIVLLLTASIYLFSIFFVKALGKGRNVVIEISENNYQILILFLGVLMTLTFTLKPGIPYLLDLLIPYPQMPTYH